MEKRLKDENDKDANPKQTEDDKCMLIDILSSKRKIFKKLSNLNTNESSSKYIQGNSSINEKLPNHHSVENLKMKTGLAKGKIFQPLSNAKIGKCKFCFKSIRKFIYLNLYKKHEEKSINMFNLNTINDILFNTNSHIVSIFKDYLYLDDLTEFLKQYHKLPESRVKLIDSLAFYNRYSKVFPNYICLKEKSYMFKRIERKQRIINEKLNENKRITQNRIHQDNNNNSRIITPEFIKNIEISLSRSIKEAKIIKQVPPEKMNMLEIAQVVSQEDTNILCPENWKLEDEITKYSFQRGDITLQQKEEEKVKEFFEIKKSTLPKFKSQKEFNKISIDKTLNQLLSFSRFSSKDLKLLSTDFSKQQFESKYFGNLNLKVREKRHNFSKLQLTKKARSIPSTPRTELGKKEEDHQKYISNSKVRPYKININLNLLIDNSINNTNLITNKLKISQTKNGLVRNSSLPLFKNNKISGLQHLKLIYETNRQFRRSVDKADSTQGITNLIKKKEFRKLILDQTHSKKPINLSTKTSNHKELILKGSPKIISSKKDSVSQKIKKINTFKNSGNKALVINHPFCNKK